MILKCLIEVKYQVTINIYWPQIKKKKEKAKNISTLSLFLIVAEHILSLIVQTLIKERWKACRGWTWTILNTWFVFNFQQFASHTSILDMFFILRLVDRASFSCWFSKLKKLSAKKILNRLLVKQQILGDERSPCIL